MFRLVFVSILLLLASACALPKIKLDPTRGSLLSATEDEIEQWDKALKCAIGIHINKLIDIWGKPEISGKPGDYEYYWPKREEFSTSGNSVPGAPGSKEIAWCDIRINTDKDGIITDTSYDDGMLHMKGIRCMRYFPFPEGFPKK
jgi:hypothetical protein